MEVDLKYLETKTLKYVNEFIARCDDASLPSYNLTQPEWSNDEFDWDRETSLENVLNLVRDKVELLGPRVRTGRILSPVPFCPTISTCLAAMVASFVSDYSRQDFKDIEAEMVNWVRDVIGYPEDSLGCITSGGTMGVVLSVDAARSACRLNHRLDGQRKVVYMTEQAHVCIEHAMLILGMSNLEIRQVQIDDRFRMDPDDLRLKIERDEMNGLRPFYAFTILGSTTSGAMDDIKAIAGIANQHEIWCHVDATIGGFYLQDESMKRHTEGLQLTQSFSTSLTKGMTMSYTVGAFFIHKPTADLRESTNADGLGGMLIANPMEEETTSARRAFQAWIGRNLLGRKFLRAFVKKSLLQRQYVQEVIQLNADFQEVGQGECCTVVIGCKGESIEQANARTQELHRMLQDGMFHVRLNTSSKRHGLILCIINHLITIEQLKTFLKSVRQKMDVILGEPGPPFCELPALEKTLGEYDVAMKEHTDKTLTCDAPFLLSKLRTLITGQHPLPDMSNVKPLMVSIKDDPTDVADMWANMEVILQSQSHPEGPTAFISALGHFVTHTLGAMANFKVYFPGATALETKVTQQLTDALFMGTSAKGALYDDATTASIPGFMVARNLRNAQDSSKSPVVYIYGDNVSDIDKAFATVGLGEHEKRILSVRDVNSLRTSLMDAVERDIQNSKHPLMLIAVIDVAVEAIKLAEQLNHLTECLAMAKQQHMFRHLVVKHGMTLLICDHSLLRVLRDLVDSATIELTDPALHPSRLVASLVADGDALISSLSTVGNSLQFVSNEEIVEQEEKKRPPTEEAVCMAKRETSMHQWIIEMSRQIRALPLWISLKTLGKAKAFEAMRSERNPSQEHESV